MEIEYIFAYISWNCQNLNTTLFAVGFDNTLYTPPTLPRTVGQHRAPISFRGITPKNSSSFAGTKTCLLPLVPKNITNQFRRKL